MSRDVFLGVFEGVKCSSFQVPENPENSARKVYVVGGSGIGRVERSEVSNVTCRKYRMFFQEKFNIQRLKCLLGQIKKTLAQIEQSLHPKYC